MDSPKELEPWADMEQISGTDGAYTHTLPPPFSLSVSLCFLFSHFAQILK